MMFIKPTKVRQLVRSHGRRSSRGWLLWLNSRVEAIVAAECAALGSRKTLSAEESELRRQVNAAVRRRR